MKTKVIGRAITIIIVLILILGGAFAYAYFGTDIFKTNEQLFFKYLGQVVDTQDGFIDSKLTEYSNKKLTGKYEDSGKFSANIDISGMDSDMLQTINDFNIEYSGKVDNTTRKNEQDITLNYSDDVNLPFKYKYADETLGLQTDYVSSKYIGIENRNLKEFVEKFGVEDTDQIPDSIDFFSELTNQENMQLSDEEREQIKNTYAPIIQEKLSGKEFTKTEDNGVTSYSVEITNQEIKDLLVEVLETLKDDEILMPKIEHSFKEILDSMNEIYKEANSRNYEDVTIESIIEEMIDDLKDSDVEEGTNTITVSQTNRKLSAITFETSNESVEVEIKITKTNDSENLTYGMEMNMTETENEDTTKFFFTASYQGLEQLETVNEDYQFGLTVTMDGEEQKMEYNLNCTDTFNDGLTIEDYKENEIQVLNDYDAEEIATVMMNVVERIGEVNAEQMEQIDFEEYGNPIIYAFPFTSIGLITYEQNAKIINENSMDEQYKTYNENNNLTGDESNASDENSNMSAEDMMSELEKSSNDLTNATISQYEGEIRGTQVRDLLMYVSTSNASKDDDQKIQVSGDITMSKDDTSVPTTQIKSGSTYNVELKYNDGVINEIIITER